MIYFLVFVYRFCSSAHTPRFHGNRVKVLGYGDQMILVEKSKSFKTF